MQTQHRLPISWSANDGDSGVNTTQLWAKFGSSGTWAYTGLSQTGTSGTFNYTPTSGDGTYYFASVSTDNQGNVEATPIGSGDSNTVVDRAKPASGASSPAYETTSTVEVTWTASDATSGVSSTRLWVKYGSGGTWTSTSLTQSGTSGTFNYSPSSGDGTYYLATVATDVAGNVESTPSGDGDTITVIDTTKPDSNADSPTYANAAIAVSWSAGDATSGVSSTRLWVKIGAGGTWTSTTLTQTGTSGTFNYTPSSGDGAYYFATVATDTAGNVESSPSVDGDSVTVVDATIPYSAADSSMYDSNPVSVSWTAGDATSGVSLYTVVGESWQ